jgi:hypothetical protein
MLINQANEYVYNTIQNSIDICCLMYPYRLHIQDGGMHAAFDQNKSIYFANQARYGIIVNEV